VLEQLHVKDLALIEDVWLDFSAGMTVMTGETGAGKTALVGALKLLVGERADSSAVRSGAAEALVEGMFKDAGTEVLVKRRVGADGRSRCVIDDEMASVSALGERIGPLVDLHGQHDHQALLRPATHVGYLDRWIGETAVAALSVYRTALDGYRGAVERLAELEEASRSAASELDRLTLMVDDIARVDPRAGEDSELEAGLPALLHAERLAEAAGAVAAELRGEGGALDRLAVARAQLERVSDIDPKLDEMTDSLRQAEALVDDIGSTARMYRDAVDHDPERVERAQARLGALSALKKRYGPTLDDVLDARSRAEAVIAVAGGAGGALDDARADVERARLTLVDAAENLDGVRRDGAEAFCAVLRDETSQLGMAGAEFGVAIERRSFDSWTADGPSRVEISYGASAMQPLRPLSRIASGGEVSRVMLALKCALRGADDVSTLVFDEIDAGIGGATAHSVGIKLAELAQTHQVVAITHLAQVAAFADTHLVVRKVAIGNDVRTVVELVEGDERVRELARMLSGDDSEASMTHARAVLEKSRKGD